MIRRRRDAKRVGLEAPAMTDQQIADELNRRHGTTRNNKANVAATRLHAEKKLVRKLLRDRALIEAYGLLSAAASSPPAKAPAAE